MKQATTHEFWVSVDNVDTVKDRVAKLNSKAKKLGVQPLTLELTSDFRAEGRMETRQEWHKQQRLVVNGVRPVLPGKWKVAGRITHYNGAVLCSVADKGLWDPKQRDRAGVCDHCGVKRARNTTFVLCSASGEIKQVGSTCLADFVGGDEVQRLADFWVEVASKIDEFEKLSVSSSSHVSLRRVVSIARAITLTYGFVSKAKAEEELRCSTSSEVVVALSGKAKLSEDCQEILSGPSAESDVKAAIEWAKGLSESEFDRNLSAVASCDAISDREIGLASFIFEGWQRSREKARLEALRASLAETSGYVGEQKPNKKGEMKWVRMEAFLTLISVRTLESNYGTTYLARFVDESGNAITWFSSGPLGDEFSEGIPVAVKMTPKKHEEFNGLKQTIVNRVKAI